MKTLRHILFLLITFLFCTPMPAQTSKIDSVYWDNGDVSLLSQLGPVWIIVKQGSDKKEVRIVEIKKQKGILVYEKEKCQHDVNISNIKTIQPGRRALSCMYFYSDNTPYIKKQYIQLDPLLAYSDFKSLKITVSPPVKLSEPTATVIVIAPSTPIENTEGIACDTIIEENGHLSLVKIVEIDSKLIHYKKIKNLNGPIYVRCSNNAGITRYDKCVTINFKKPIMK